MSIEPPMSEQTPRDDLVERLRRREPSFTGGSLRNPDGPEAADRIERSERALANVLSLLTDLDEYMKRPEHGEYGVECAVCMGEWFEPGDRAAINEATAALKGRER